jgi:hypothetical protein
LTKYCFDIWVIFGRQDPVNGAWLACWMFLDLFVTGSLLWKIQGFGRGTLPHTVSLVRRLIVLVRFFDRLSM